MINKLPRHAARGLVLLLLISSFVRADRSESQTPASKLYFSCSSCHGEQGRGRAPIHAPAIAGQLPAYLGLQLRNFRDGIRGAHKSDKYGRQMALMAANLRDDEKIETLAEFIAAMPVTNSLKSITGETTKGKEVYTQQCAACHGVQGEGNDALLAPRLAGLDDWYVLEQLQHFRRGVRGYAANDVYGKQMRAAVRALNDDALRDVVAYINGFRL